MIHPIIDDAGWIPAKTLAKLKEGGLVSLLDLALAPPELLQRLGLSGDEASRLAERAGENFGYVSRGDRAVARGRRRRRITTGASSLDRLLGGGVQSGRVTEFYGESGTGKTQLCFQLCVNAQIPAEGGGDIVFVDTAGTFRPERIVEMAEERTVKELFRRIFLVNARTSAEQVKVPRRLEELVSSREIRMLIIDTLTDNFVYEFQGEEHMGDRQAALARHLHELAFTALDRDIPVVVTNTVRARMAKKWGVVETGGNTVTQGVHVRVRLERVAGGWSARLDDREPSIRFKIGKEGIMDWEE